MRITWREDDKYLIEDLNSSNGVWLNETRLMPRIPAELNIGDTIRVGPFLLELTEFLYEEDKQPEPFLGPDLSTPEDYPEAEQTGQQILPRIPPQAIQHTRHMNGHHPRRVAGFLPGIPRDRSNWMKYLPEVFDSFEFIGRYLLIFESLAAPLFWTIDNFDLYLSPEVMPEDWIQWISSWFDLLILPELHIDKQRRIMEQLGWLFLRRGTPSGLERMLELYFEVTPEIIENGNCHFTVRLPLSDRLEDDGLGREVADRIINSQRPSFSSYLLEIT
jgi:phage tail-like protein